MAGIIALVLGYVLSQFYRTFLAVLTPILGADLGMTKADFALASGIWYVAFALMQFVIGVGLDRHGPRLTTIAIMLPFGVAGGLMFAAAQSPLMIIIAMALIGVAFSPVLMAAMFVFAKTMEASRFAAASSMFIGVGIAGAVLGASPLAIAAEAVGWRTVMAMLAGLTFIVSALIWFGLKDPAREPLDSGSVGLGGYVELLRIRALWPIFPAVFVAYAAMIGPRGLWAGPYLTTMHGADARLIGDVTFWMSIAMVIAAFSIVPLSRMVPSNKRLAMGLNLCVAGACAVLAFNPAMPLWAAACALVAITLFGSSFVVQAAHGRAFYPPHLVGRGVTLLNAFSIGGAGILQFITGALVSATSNPGAPGLQWSVLFGFYALALIAAVAVYALSRDAKH
ncbi:MAG: MFS transporter [Rhizobiaceae bacterium]|jgi:predicted MFS family arabinose efflux permease|nr:MFS transporter [Rhizobiaceae bacterium]